MSTTAASSGGSAATAVPSEDDITPNGPDPQTLERVRSGQRFILGALSAYLVAVVVRLALARSHNGIAAGASFVVLLLALAILGLGIVGLLRLVSGFGYSTGKTALIILLMVIPLVGLFTLGYLDHKATKLLRQYGYRVGFLGARG